MGGSRPNLTNLVGQRFGMLLVLSVLGVKEGRIVWLCRCDCGCGAVIYGKSLLTGNSSSCGCRQIKAVYRRRTHGMSGTKIFALWFSMIQRCTNPNAQRYDCYGGRGITVCDRWKNSFENFYADMGDRPPGRSLDRIDNDAGYSPENCRWATYLEQGQNSRATKPITWRGATKGRGGWARHFRASPSWLAKLIRQRGEQGALDFIEARRNG